MKRIAIIQLGRSCDVVDTFSSVAGLKKKYPDLVIDFIVRDFELSTAQLCREADNVYGLPTAAILGPNQAKEERLAHLISWLADTILMSTEAHGPYDSVINLTFSESSSFLTQLIPALHRKGLHRASDGARQVKDPWSLYVTSQVLTKNLDVFSLKELFNRIADVDPQKNSIVSTLIEKRKKVVQKNLIGLAEDLRHFDPEPILNLLQKKEYQVKKFRLFTSRRNHYLVAPWYESLDASLKKRLELMAPPSNLDRLLECSQIIAFSRSRESSLFSLMGLDVQDLSLKAHVIGNQFSLDRFFAQAYQLLFEFRCSGNKLETNPPLFDFREPHLEEHLNLSLDAMKALSESCTFARKSCIDIIKNIEDKKLLKELNERINEVDYLIQSIRNSCFYLKPIIDFWELAKENVMGDNLLTLASCTEGVYRELQENISILQDLLKISLDATEASQSKKGHELKGPEDAHLH